MRKIIAENGFNLFKANKNITRNKNITKEIVRGNKDEVTYKEIRNN